MSPSTANRRSRRELGSSVGPRLAPPTRCKSTNELATSTAGTEVSHTPASGVMTWAPALGSVNAAAEVSLSGSSELSTTTLLMILVSYVIGCGRDSSPPACFDASSDIVCSDTACPPGLECVLLVGSTVSHCERSCENAPTCGACECSVFEVDNPGQDPSIGKFCRCPPCNP